MDKRAVMHRFSCCVLDSGVTQKTGSNPATTTFLRAQAFGWFMSVSLFSFFFFLAAGSRQQALGFWSSMASMHG